MIPRCHRCHRKLKNPVIVGDGVFGSVCARAMFGVKAKRIAREDRRSDDERQAELFYPEAFHSVLGVAA